MRTVMMSGNFQMTNLPVNAPKTFVGDVGEIIERATVILFPVGEHVTVTVTLTINWDALLKDIAGWKRDTRRLGEIVGHPILTECPVLDGTVDFVNRVGTNVVGTSTFDKTIAGLLNLECRQVTQTDNLYKINYASV